jgi:hypothetical protein
VRFIEVGPGGSDGGDGDSADLGSDVDLGNGGDLGKAAILPISAKSAMPGFAQRHQRRQRPQRKARRRSSRRAASVPDCAAPTRDGYVSTSWH